MTCACDHCDAQTTSPALVCARCEVTCAWTMLPGLGRFENAAAGIWRWRVHRVRIVPPDLTYDALWALDRESALEAEGAELDYQFRQMFTEAP